MIKTTKDGRTIRAGVDYAVFRRAIFTAQNELCIRCGRYCDIHAEPQDNWSFHVHHKNGRGLGGGKRNDMQSECEGLCGNCHRKEHNQ